MSRFSRWLASYTIFPNYGFVALVCLYIGGRLTSRYDDSVWIGLSWVVLTALILLGIKGGLDTKNKGTSDGIDETPEGRSPESN